MRHQYKSRERVSSDRSEHWRLELDVHREAYNAPAYNTETTAAKVVIVLSNFTREKS